VLEVLMSAWTVAELTTAVNPSFPAVVQPAPPGNNQPGETVTITGRASNEHRVVRNLWLRLAGLSAAWELSGMQQRIRPADIYHG